VLPEDPHREAEIFQAGAESGQASGVMLLLHGRGASAPDILSLGQEVAPSDLTLIAPEAAGNNWYPYSFLSPLSQNEPWLSSALHLVERLVQQSLSDGTPAERIVLCGFSQGACLATEFVARRPRRYGALLAFTGGLIGPPGSDLRHPGNLDGVSALFSSGDPDPHVPWTRVEESARELRGMGADVQIQRYPGRPHTIVPQEVTAARNLVKQVFARYMP
jgi:phospholipase/carboxylesterase